MREGKRAPTVVGGISLLVIFAVLCLTVFAVLSLAQGQADRRLAQSSWSAVTGYYRADCQAQEILSRLRAGERPEGVTEEGEGIFSYACPISDTQTLQVRVRLAGRAMKFSAGRLSLRRTGRRTTTWTCGTGAHDFIKRSKEERTMAELMDYLTQAVERRASDLFFVAGGSASAKVEGQIMPLDDERLLPPKTEELLRAIYGLAGRDMDGFLARGDDDFSFSVRGVARFRVNAYRQRGSMAAVVRVVAFEIPDFQALHIPSQVMDLAGLTYGMVLVSGTAGSGKSTTQACILDRINRTRNCHIITLEDPIEYLHRDRRSIVSQREIAIDTRDYLSALRSCLRQAPDVILLGEMRDHETIQTAMTAAETGHLLIATLHTRGAVNTIDRIIDSFPPAQQAQVRVQLSAVLRTVVSQQLLPDVDGEQVPAFEVMQMNSAIRSMIRDGKDHQIDNAIAAGGSEGMLTMDQSILALYQAGRITRDTALNCADNPEQLKRRMGN